jgi:DNA-binding CsgD family transcriptional regulator
MKNPDTSAPTSVGVLLMDRSMYPVWFNVEAVRILGYPQKPDSSKTLGADALGKKIRANLDTQSLGSPSLTELTSGKRRYLCRAFRLESQGKGNRNPSVAVLLERSPGAVVTLSAMCAQFQLTRREQETLELLSVGLCTKEIASTMQISASTAKVYVRIVMAKMGVSSRVEILAKILSMNPSGPDPARADESGCEAANRKLG